MQQNEILLAQSPSTFCLRAKRDPFFAKAKKWAGESRRTFFFKKILGEGAGASTPHLSSVYSQSSFFAECQVSEDCAGYCDDPDADCREREEGN